MKRKILLGLVVVFVVAQFLPILKPPVVQPTIANDFCVVENTPAEIAVLLRKACYDCHSYETRSFWYMKIAPASWWTGNHILEGREELNFNDWATFSAKRKKRKRQELVEQIESKEMPLWDYLLVHDESRLSDAERTAMLDYFKLGLAADSTVLEKPH